MTLDEAINDFKENNDYFIKNNMYDVAKYNMQITRWLKELKKLRVYFDERYNDIYCKGYNNCISDIKDKITTCDYCNTCQDRGFMCSNDCEFNIQAENIVLNMLDNMKASGKNDD